MAAARDREPVDDRVADRVRTQRIDPIRIRRTVGRDVRRLGEVVAGGFEQEDARFGESGDDDQQRQQDRGDAGRIGEGRAEVGDGDGERGAQRQPAQRGRPAPDPPRRTLPRGRSRAPRPGTRGRRARR